jgi:single-strand DNA-binding protein
MNGTNVVAVVGRLTRDAEIKYTGAGMAIASCAVAVNTSRKDAQGNWTDEANFFDVVVFGKTAENLKQYLLKGKQIAISGHLKQERWEKEGQKFSKVSIVADAVELLGGGRTFDEQPSHQGQAMQQSNYAQQYQQQQQAPAQQEFPEDIPFGDTTF